MKVPNLRNLRVLWMLAIPLLAFGAFAPASMAGSPQPMSMGDMSNKSSAQAFHDAMRKLWEDHITWTRLFIVSDVANLPDLNATTQRLLQNQTDIGNAIKPYFGEQAGDQLTALLRTHILGAADLLDAVKAGDTHRIEEARAAWYANADDIAHFLNSANPRFWPLEEMQTMMHQHLDLTLAEASDHFQGNYTADVADYDQVHAEILSMADELSTGIIRAFPNMFNGQ